MDLVLLGSNEGPLVNIWVDLNIRVVAEFERVLGLSASRFSLAGEMDVLDPGLFLWYSPICCNRQAYSNVCILLS